MSAPLPMGGPPLPSLFGEVGWEENAGARPKSVLLGWDQQLPMFLIDDLLGLPIGGFKFVLRTLQQVAEEQYTDSGPIKERLLELQVQLESDEISEKEYTEAETEIFRQLREIEARKRSMAGVSASDQLITSSASASASVSADLSYGRRHNEKE
jgi:Gas vesicle protein G